MLKAVDRRREEVKKHAAYGKRVTSTFDPKDIDSVCKKALRVVSIGDAKGNEIKCTSIYGFWDREEELGDREESKYEEELTLSNLIF
jgi:hypothetical protein